MIPQETDSDLPVGVQESPAEVWVVAELAVGLGALSVIPYVGSLEGGHHYLHYFHHSLAPGK